MFPSRINTMVAFTNCKMTFVLRHWLIIYKNNLDEWQPRVFLFPLNFLYYITISLFTSISILLVVWMCCHSGALMQICIHMINVKITCIAVRHFCIQQFVKAVCVEISPVLVYFITYWNLKFTILHSYFIHPLSV